ncbi:MAG TPA: ABC transporter permease [Thermomicrobiales bacterium]
MRLEYVIRRLLLFVIVVWVAATLNFFLPRISGGDPVRTKLMEQAAAGGNIQSGLQQMVAEYQHKFGLDRPLWKQYLTYLGQVARLDFGYSIAAYPQTVFGIIGRAIPWTVGLLLTTTLLAFLIGTVLGALMAWPRAPHFIQFLFPPLLTLSAIPFFLLGLLLTYVFAFRLPWFPLSGGYNAGTIPHYSVSFALDVFKHSVLPACAILLSSIGFWALGMRGMMVTVEGEDYMTFAEAAGLKGRTLFFTYALRNAILPQTTALALSLSQILSGALLVEVIFSYPGLGSILYNAIRQFDYFLLQGLILTIVLAVSIAALIVDFTYPLLDPRISYRRT